jgi:hypothetical protein
MGFGIVGGTMQKWEYKRVFVLGGRPFTTPLPSSFPPMLNLTPAEAHEQTELLMNTLGAEGWDLAGTLSTEHPSHHLMYFKRPKS